MKIYSRVFFNTLDYSFELITAKTELEADIKAWSFIVNNVEQRRNVFTDYYDEDIADTFEKFRNRNYVYYDFRDGGTLECAREVTEI